MNGIKMSDCRFYVNEEERVVVCVIPNTRDMLMDYIEEHFNWHDMDVSSMMYWNTREKLYKMPNSFIGKAVCAKEDEWNEETGRLIAFSRAKDKCYKSFFKRANALINNIDRRLGDMIESFNNFGTRLDEKRLQLEQKIDERVKK